MEYVIFDLCDSTGQASGRFDIIYAQQKSWSLCINDQII
jgi:hypothetical protein